MKPEKKSQSANIAIQHTLAEAYSGPILLCGLVLFSLIKGFEGATLAICIGAIASVAGILILYRQSKKHKE